MQWKKEDFFKNAVMSIVIAGLGSVFGGGFSFLAVKVFNQPVLGFVILVVFVGILTALLYLEFEKRRKAQSERKQAFEDRNRIAKLPKETAETIVKIGDEIEKQFNEKRKSIRDIRGATLYLPYEHLEKEHLFFFAMFPNNKAKDEKLRKTLDHNSSASKAFLNSEKSPTSGDGEDNDKVMNIVVFSKSGEKLGVLQYVASRTFEKEDLVVLSGELDALVQQIERLNNSYPKKEITDNMLHVIPPQPNNAVVMFCDITNSTQLLDFGIRDWVNQSIEFTTMIENVAHEYGGRRFCSNQGDGTWIGFCKTRELSEDAFLTNVKAAAQKMAVEFEKFQEKHKEDGRIRKEHMHISMHYGHVMAKQHGELFDSTVEFYGLPFIRAHEGLLKLSKNKNSESSEIFYGNLEEYIKIS